MDQEHRTKAASLQLRPSAEMQSPLIDVVEASATKGEWTTPAVKKVSLALALTNFSARWRGAQGLRSEQVSAGTVALCPFNHSQRFEMQSTANFGIVMLPNELLEQAGQGTRHIRPELQACDLFQDMTLRRLTKILLSEKRSGFQSGMLFLDSMAAALAGYLLRHYSAASPALENTTGGLAPSVLRRCIEFIETHLEGDLRLNDLAQEAKISTSHLIRSFRHSTGKTPTNFFFISVSSGRSP